MYYYLVGLVLLGSCLADKPEARSADYSPPVKYGGPIVYSGEKPPIIHFPPPPREVSSCQVIYRIRFNTTPGSIFQNEFFTLNHHIKNA